VAIIDELIASIRADSPVREVRVGLFQTAVLADRCGLASTLSQSHTCHGHAAMRDAGLLSERSARQLAYLARSGVPLESAVGVAALNALLDTDEANCVEVNAGSLLLERARGKRVALIGHFPFVPDLRQAARQLSVLEIDPREGDLEAGEAERVIPEADVVAITGSSLVNRTFDGLLKLCHPDSFVAILGPSTPLSPLLFDHGVDALSGTLVTNPELVLRCIEEGATYRQIRGVRRVTLFREGR